MRRGSAALRAVARSEIRRRWLGLLAIGVLAGLVGGVVIGAASGIRRSQTAYDRLVDTTAFPDVLIQLFEPPPGAAEFVASRPEVESLVESRYSVGAHLGLSEPSANAAFGQAAYVPVVHGARLPFTPQIVEGRAPDPTAIVEVLLSERFASQLGLVVGDVIPWHGLSHRQFASFGDGFDGFEGPRVDLEVVGLTRLPSDATMGELPAIFGTNAFHEAHAASLPAMHSLWIDLAPGASEGTLTEALGGYLYELGVPAGGVFGPFFAVPLAGSSEALDGAVHLTSIGLGAMMGVALAAGLFVLGQMVSRHLLGRREEDAILHALGLGRRARVRVTVLAGLVSLPAAAIGAFGVAAGMSSLFPVGAARDVEPNPGMAVNVALVSLGIVALLGVLVSLWWLVGRRFSRSGGPDVAGRGDGPPRVAVRLFQIPRSVPVSIGGRMAFDPGAGRTAVPVRLAVFGTAAGLAGVLAAFGFSASLDGLVASPSRWGQPADVVVQLTDDVRTETVDRLLRADEVGALTLVTTASIDIGGVQTSAYGIEPRKGDLLPTVIDGRLPAGPHEIALGPELLEDIGREVGEDVLLSGPDGQGGDPVVLTIVGSVLTGGFDQDRYTTGAVVLVAGLERIAQSQGFVAAYVDLTPGVNPSTVDDLLGGAERSLPSPPVEIENLSALGSLPEVMGALLGILAVAALVHTVIVFGRRRRPDLAVLRSLGFTRSQTRHAVTLMAVFTTVAGVGIGAPAGVMLANVSWTWVAQQLHVATGFRLPATSALVPVAAVAVAGLVSLVPARRASGTRPAQLLRVE